MRLTNDIRRTIRRAVEADLQLTSSLRDQMLARAMELAIERLPRLVRQVWNDPKLRGYINTEIVWGEDIEGVYYLPAPGGDPDLRDVLREDETYQKLHSQFEVIEKVASDALDVLAATLRSVTTVEQLAERYPDLVKYLPTQEQAAANLPATTDLMDKLRAAGLRTEETKP